MRISALFLLLPFMFLFSACNRDAAADQGREVKAYTIEQFMNTVNYFGGEFAPDEKSLLVTNNSTGIYNAYEISLDGGQPVALTNSTGSSVFAISFFPEDKRLLYSMDNNGNEIGHLFLRELSGEVKELTPDSLARASFYGWAHDRKSFFYGYTLRDPRLTDVYEMDIATLQPKLLYQNDAAFEFGGISNDKQYMALVKPINTNDSELYLYHFPSKKLTKVSDAQASFEPASFSVDNSSLYYLTDKGGEFRYLVRYDIASGKRENVFETNWDVSFAYFSRQGKYRVIGTNEDAKTVIRILDTQSGKEVAFPAFEKGDVSSVTISDSEKLMSFYVRSSASPGDLYLYDFAGGQPRKLAESLNAEINPDDLVEAEVVRYSSFDGKEIPAIYYRPHQASADNKLPALVWVHGGPGGQSRQNYNALLQYLVNQGYAVLAVNNRGSSGYGKTFFQMDDQNHGEGDLQDCIWGKKWLAEQNYIDSTKIGIIGGSYGGFMVMRAMTHTPDAFAVGVDIFGVTNWLRTLRNIPPWWESFKVALYQEMGDPNTADSLRLYNISPVFHGNQVKNPVMVLQGSQDPRVLQAESDDMVAAMRKNKVPVEYVLFPDEGHGFVKKKNEIEGYGKILRFLDQYLKKAEQVKG